MSPHCGKGEWCGKEKAFAEGSPEYRGDHQYYFTDPVSLADPGTGISHRYAELSWKSDCTFKYDGHWRFHDKHQSEGAVYGCEAVTLFTDQAASDTGSWYAADPAGSDK